MAGSWRVNILLGFFAFLFTYLFSMGNNTWLTSFIRAGFGFLLFFLIGYILRFIMEQIISKKNPSLDQIARTERVGNQKMEPNQQDHEVSKDEPTFQSLPLGALHQGMDENGPK